MSHSHTNSKHLGQNKSRSTGSTAQEIISIFASAFWSPYASLDSLYESSREINTKLTSLTEIRSASLQVFYWSPQVLSSRDYGFFWRTFCIHCIYLPCCWVGDHCQDECSVDINLCCMMLLGGKWTLLKSSEWEWSVKRTGTQIFPTL